MLGPRCRFTAVVTVYKIKMVYDASFLFYLCFRGEGEVGRCLTEWVKFWRGEKLVGCVMVDEFYFNLMFLNISGTVDVRRISVSFLCY
ncbi:hypothetical protein B5B97_01685 [Staphylococcus delphini]|nr:hypothetical protein B5B99_03550 [Staphylococcus delphini]PCF59137.1 hypothetical protein B5B97_01685 [Staphylococcus delphini]PCF60429.1 hypothetical protein B5C05_04470 [Staphylococcus delphini]